MPYEATNGQGAHPPIQSEGSPDAPIVSPIFPVVTGLPIMKAVWTKHPFSMI